MKLDLPKLIEADDYHDFDYFERQFQEANSKIKCREIGFIWRQPPLGTYLGVIYTGRKPSKKKLQEMIDEQDFNGEVELN